MSISVTGKLNKAANQFQAGDSKGFGVRLGVRFYNRETKSQEYTNYEAVIFAKEGKQADFYSSALVEGSVIEINGTGCQIKTFESNKGPVHSISILDAKLGYMATVGAPQPQAQQQQSQPANNPTIEDMDEDIPFS